MTFDLDSWPVTASYHEGTPSAPMTQVWFQLDFIYTYYYFYLYVHYSKFKLAVVPEFERFHATWSTSIW